MGSSLHAGYGGEQFFAPTDFDHLRHDALQTSDFNFFDSSMESTGDSFLLWDHPAKARPGVAVNGSLTHNAFDHRPLSMDYDGAHSKSPQQEPTPPLSAVDKNHNQTWGGQNSAIGSTRPKRNLAFLNTANAPMDQYGQITPPMSSGSPEIDGGANSTSGAAGFGKRGRKSSTKTQSPSEDAGSASASPPPGSPNAGRSTRKRKSDAVSEQEEEPRTEEAQIKRARFLERNRQAAFTCRQRKKQWARDLEDRHRAAERDNQNLKLVLNSLRDEFQYLRQQVISHTTCECSGAREYITRSSQQLSAKPMRKRGNGGDVAERHLGDDPRTVMDPATMQSIDLEHALQSSMATFATQHGVIQPRDLDGLGFAHDGPDLDAMRF